MLQLRFQGKNHQSDITVGGFGGLTPDMAGYNRNGVSVLIVNMKKGEELNRNLDTKEFSIQEVDADTTKCTSGAEKRFRIMINMGTLRQAYSPVIIA